ncbi:NUDIX hydrolase [Paenibacillus sp. HGH0039]|uniref:NUDIX hydrolase n=1 Tax=Paenibacillus sp. HGH0039 TaxID=1078505 RepID=UPI00020D7F1B|nr:MULTISPECIES: NUDIX domain-containing protein [unclassified Paenibacillus]EGL17802.1 hydrolase, NUDIX family [Paenibacillus sp. HGF7]EPD81502.1 hypothetical protein HMPREF1207_05260 [Paenibacillus sp. HGH0039]
MQTKRIRCACLVKRDGTRLLLVRVRDNERWYLPGGKIEEGEDPEAALKRELKEELNLDLLPESISYLRTVIGAAYKEDAQVELVCYEADWNGQIAPCSEISEAGWIEMDRHELLAPAVVDLVRAIKNETESDTR